MRIAEFRHRITFQAYTEGQTANGFFSPTWSDVATVWAAAKTVQGREFVAGNMDRNSVTTRFIIRYREGLNEDMRILFDNRIFEITSILRDNEMKKTLTVVCEEII